MHYETTDGDLEFAMRDAFEIAEGQEFETLWIALCFIDGDSDDLSAFAACLVRANSLTG